MRILVLTAILALGMASSASAARCRDATGRVVACPAAYGAATSGVGRTVVVAGPASRARPLVRCGPRRCGRVAAVPVAAAPPPSRPSVPQPAPGYAPQ